MGQAKRRGSFRERLGEALKEQAKWNRFKHLLHIISPNMSDLYIHYYA